MRGLLTCVCCHYGLCMWPTLIVHAAVTDDERAAMLTCNPLRGNMRVDDAQEVGGRFSRVLRVARARRATVERRRHSIDVTPALW